MTEPGDLQTDPAADRSPIGRLIGFCLTNKLVVALIAAAIILWGLIVAPFDWDLGPLPRRSVPTDAIPDIGENQQILFTEWPGASPKDVDDQITYPLTAALLGISGVKTVRSVSMLGFSSVYVIFDEDVGFDTSRNRILTKLSSLSGQFPEGVQPAMGPEATALGQVFWYTLEGRDPDGKPAGGWDLDELRSLQDWNVRYALLATRGIAEVASVGGFVKEYQIDVDPDAMRAYGVTLRQIFDAVKASNVDVGARTIEINRAEYIVRGLGFIKHVGDLENTAVAARDNVPVLIKNVGRVTLGPAVRRGALDKGGAEAVGGVVVVRYGFNPLEAIKNVKATIENIEPGLPRKPVIDYHLATRPEVTAFATAQGFVAYDGPALHDEAWLQWLDHHDRAAWPPWVTTSKVHIVPFYDRTGLIYETLGTLNRALSEEIMVTIIVILVMVANLRSSLLVSVQLPLAVLMCFIAMKLFGVDANIVALSGIAIAIGTIVDMGIVITENILRHLESADPAESRLAVVHRAATEVGSAVLTAVMTTVVGFLPVFAMTGAVGKLFRPLAFTKTFALASSIVIALTIIPPIAYLLLGKRWRLGWLAPAFYVAMVASGLALGFLVAWWAGAIVAAVGLWQLLRPALPQKVLRWSPWVINGAAVLLVAVLLTRHWLPIGPTAGLLRNLVFVAVVIGGLLLLIVLFQRVYPRVLAWCLDNKALFLTIPLLMLVAGVGIWRNLGQEFMPPLDEGSFLYMPTTMTHASIGEAIDVVAKQDMAFGAIPEIETVVGKIGRAETPLDPAPISMIESVITYKTEFIEDADGRPLTFRYDTTRNEFVRNERGELIPDDNGRPVRQWREHIHSPQDIWKEIVAAGRVPGTTSAPPLQPIAARIVMLQSGMRSPMGLKIMGPDIEMIEKVGLQIEGLLKEVPGVDPSSVIADRIVGKPYLEIAPRKESMDRYGLTTGAVMHTVSVAIGGMKVTTTVEGQQRYPVRVRYARELRDTVETLGRILVPTPDGKQIPLDEVADINYVRGPQAIKRENAAKVGYVLFDKQPGEAEVDVVNRCKAFLDQRIAANELRLPAGVHLKFAGTYENQAEWEKTRALVLPLALFVIFMILYFQFRAVLTSMLVFSGIFVAWAGGFIMIWLYGQPWFLDFAVFGVNLRELFQVHPINLSVAIWVGFLALFGIASDDGVVMATYLVQSFSSRRTTTVAECRSATLVAARRRIRPCLMTTATTILALVPVLTSTGRGSDIMLPMAIPSFGGMAIEVITMLIVPVLYCQIKEIKLRAGIRDRHLDA